MHSKTFYAVFALATAVIAAPLPNDDKGSTDVMQSIENLLGSPFGNGNGNGNNNGAGNNNDDNGSGNGAGNGNNNGNKNQFGNGNNIGSGNSGLKIGRNDDKESLGDWISGLVGSPFGNGNENGNGNEAGSGNDENGAGNGVDNGNGNGNGNEFGNGNNIGSGNNGISIGRRAQKVRKSDTLGNYLGNVVDSVTVPVLDPTSPDTIWASPANNGNNNGNGNNAGSNNGDNGSGNGNSNGNNNGNDNQFGNGNDLLSGNCGVRARDLPDGALSLIPDQTLTSLNKVASQLVTDGPEDLTTILEGALAGEPTDSKFSADEKRQILTGLEDVIAQDLAKYIP